MQIYESSSWIQPTSNNLVSFGGMLEAYQELGFGITKFEVTGQHAELNPTSEKMCELAVLAEQKKKCYFDAYNSEMEFEIIQYIDWNYAEMGGPDRVWIVAIILSSGYFRRDMVESSRYVGLLLDIGRRLYEVFRPSFGWCAFDDGVNTTWEDIEKANLPVLYWANFIGPAFVRAIGKQKIISARHWILQKLSDGGLLYVLSPNPGVENGRAHYEDIKAHFKISRIR